VSITGSGNVGGLVWGQIRMPRIGPGRQENKPATRCATIQTLKKSWGKYAKYSLMS